MNLRAILPISLMLAGTMLSSQAGQGTQRWEVGTPIVTYWAGPAMNDQTAQQMSQGGWKLVWWRESELDVAARYGLRAQLQDWLLTPASLETPSRRDQLDALVERVRHHPALYS